MGRKSETGGVSPAGDRIQVRIPWRGKEVRPTLALKPTAANLKHARRLREAALDEIKNGTFNLAEYFPDYKFADQHAAVATRDFKAWADAWKEVSERELEASTLAIYKRHLDAYWVSTFGNEDPRSITHERILRHLALLSKDRFDERIGKNRRGLSRKTQNNVLIPLRGVFELICKAEKHMTNPTEGIANLRIQKGLPDPFDADEVEVILAKIKELHGEEACDYFDFAFFAGLRTSEQIALLWRDVDLRRGEIRVHRARVMYEDKERTKTNKERLVELNSRAVAVLERQRARTQLAQDHVFRNPATGKPWNDDGEQRELWITALRLAKIRYRPPKECRDTSVTLALMAGADPVWVAAQHGHSVQVMLRDYARFIPKADRGRNLAAVNRSLSGDSAVNPQLADKSAV